MKHFGVQKIFIILFLFVSECLLFLILHENEVTETNSRYDTLVTHLKSEERNL